MIEVSVVIAVYNAERFVISAVKSALIQDETREVILVEDGSTDGSLAKCEYCTSLDARVRLLRHSDCRNHGAAASFNLGIEQARMPYIGILGADDEYVDSAFSSIAMAFGEHPDADGVYGHIGVKYHDPEYKSLHLMRIPGEISGLEGHTPSPELLDTLLLGEKGHISLDGLVLKRSSLGSLRFDEALRQAQDTDFIYRLAAQCKLIGLPDTTIIALRGVHNGNRVFDFRQAGYYSGVVAIKCIRNDFYGSRNRKAMQKVIHRYINQSRLLRIPLLPKSLIRKLLYLFFLLGNPHVRRRISEAQ